eukprot:gene1446-1571_t
MARDSQLLSGVVVDLTADDDDWVDSQDTVDWDDVFIQRAERKDNESEEEDKVKGLKVGEGGTSGSGGDQVQLILRADLVDSFTRILPCFSFEMGVTLSVRRADPLSEDGHAVVVVDHPQGDRDIISIAQLELSALLTNPPALTEKLRQLDGERLHVFVDYSNISIGTKKACGSNHVLVEDTLVSLVECGRPCLQRLLFGSFSHADERVAMARWEDFTYEVHLAHRHHGQREQFVDDAMIAQVHDAVLRYPSPPHPQHTLALLTGDGNDNHGRSSFFSASTLALQQGWKVEVWAWRACLSKQYQDLLQSYGHDVGLFRINYLDDHKDIITRQNNQSVLNSQEPLSRPQHHSSRPDQHDQSNDQSDERNNGQDMSRQNSQKKGRFRPRKPKNREIVRDLSAIRRNTQDNKRMRL